MQGCWEVDDESNAWEFGTVDKLRWDLDPPKLGDAQWGYLIKWDDGTPDSLLWHFNGEEWPMHYILSAFQLQSNFVQERDLQKLKSAYAYAHTWRE